MAGNSYTDQTITIRSIRFEQPIEVGPQETLTVVLESKSQAQVTINHENGSTASILTPIMVTWK